MQTFDKQSWHLTEQPRPIDTTTHNRCPHTHTQTLKERVHDDVAIEQHTINNTALRNTVVCSCIYKVSLFTYVYPDIQLVLCIIHTAADTLTHSLHLNWTV